MLVTVLTPAFNRGYIIERLYESLKAQTYKDFEWVTVDDGSVDNTEELFEKWKKESPFPITYLKTSNGGKHRAINKGVPLCSGELIFIVDSDDYLTDNALERVAFWFDTVKDREDFCGVAGLRGYSESERIGTTFEGEHLDITALEREKHGVIGDKSEVFRADVLKQFPFREFDGEKFLTENTVWYEIAGAGYKMRFFNEIIYITEYLNDGLSKNLQKIMRENLEGEIYTVNIYKKYKKLGLRGKLARYSFIYSIAKEKGVSAREIAKKLGCSVLFLKFSLFLRKAAGK